MMTRRSLIRVRMDHDTSQILHMWFCIVIQPFFLYTDIIQLALYGGISLFHWPLTSRISTISTSPKEIIRSAWRKATTLGRGWDSKALLCTSLSKPHFLIIYLSQCSMRVFLTNHHYKNIHIIYKRVDCHSKIWYLFLSLCLNENHRITTSTAVKESKN